MLTEDPQVALQAIRDAAEKVGMIVISAPSQIVELPKFTTTYWLRPWAEYIELAQRLGARVLYVENKKFDLETEVAELLAGEKRFTNTEEWLEERMLEDLDVWSQYNNQPHRIRTLFIADGVAHGLELTTRWYPEFEEAADSVLARALEVKEQDRRSRSAEEATSLMDMAVQMARHERFEDASSADKREFMASQLFSDLDPYRVKDLASLAALVYWWDVEPTVRVAKAQRVRELRAAGESLKGIAGMLKMSEAKVRAALDSDD